jgi:hypothetical protein
MAARRPNFRGQVMAVDRVEKLLRKVGKALDKARIPYAVIGGNAVAAWVATVDDGAVRATKDVDILVRRGDLPSITEALRPAGLVPIEVLGVTIFVDRRRPNPRTGVHLVFANEHIRPHYTHPAPDPESAVRSQAGFLIVDLPALVRMKLQSFRRVDQVHIEDLLRIGLLHESLINELPADLRERLQHIQATME